MYGICAAPGARERKDLAMDRHDVIATLNELIETCTDGEEGFRTCAEGVKNPQLKVFFEKRADRCALGAAQLEGKVAELGGDPRRGGSPSAMLHRFWINIRSTISGMDEEAVLAECERGEDFAKTAYEEALRCDLPGDVRVMIAKQYREVRENHDRVRDMRNAMA
jgi:uncharacterized protein (TIGR02284 family)